MATKVELEDQMRVLEDEVERLRERADASVDGTNRPEVTLPDQIAAWINERWGTEYSGDNILVVEVRKEKVAYQIRKAPQLPGIKGDFNVYWIVTNENGSLVE